MVRQVANSFLAVGTIRGSGGSHLFRLQALRLNRLAAGSWKRAIRTVKGGHPGSLWKIRHPDAPLEFLGKIRSAVISPRPSFQSITGADHRFSLGTAAEDHLLVFAAAVPWPQDQWLAKAMGAGREVYNNVVLLTG
ncbi:hypothetical protein BVX99_01260 [bacterium F16]|nr:hypothetical protein BVX99_01260 [bacterium F16]